MDWNGIVDNAEAKLKPAELRQVMARHGFQLKKGYGQNFLIDTRVLDAIVQAAELDETTGAFEVGPGAGVVTRPLSFAAKRIVAVEKDESLAPVLAETVGDRANVEIIYGDVLETDLAQVWDRFSDCSHIVVVANLPYYVTTPILFYLLESDLPMERIVVMVQQEVAERMMAQPATKAYGALSVAVQARAAVTKIVSVPAGAFLPPPTVASAVVKLQVYHEPPVPIGDPARFRRVVKAAFGMRRKTLLNALSAGFGITKEEVQQWLDAAGIDGRRRGETLSLTEFARLSADFH